VPAPDRRSIIRQGGFEESLQILFSTWDGAEKYIAAAEIVLAMEPQLGMPIGDGIWVLPMAPVKNADVWLFYTFYETVVILLDVQAFGK
jgi:hypothetical protein